MVGDHYSIRNCSKGSQHWECDYRGSDSRLKKKGPGVLKGAPLPALEKAPTSCPDQTSGGGLDMLLPVCATQHAKRPLSGTKKDTKQDSEENVAGQTFWLLKCCGVWAHDSPLPTAG